MGPIVLTICIISVLAVSAIVFVLCKRHSKTTETPSLGNSSELIKSEQSEMIVKFENLPSLTEKQQSSLIEIKDKKLLARIGQALPGTIQAMANSGAAKTYKDTAKGAGQLYRAVIPKNAVMYKAKDMPNAVRGGYHFNGSAKVAGQAHFVPVDNKDANNLATLGSVNAVMGVASMVVGQYYMTQINDKLSEISSEVQKIAEFQKDQIKSDVYALVAEVYAKSDFQIEIIEKEEERNRVLNHLDDLMNQCTRLLGHANFSLQGIAKKTGIDYNEYEELIGEAEIWFQYQQVLKKLLYKMADLKYVFNLGGSTREYCYSLCQPYENLSENTLKELKKWHAENVARLKIDVSENRRKRQGVGGVFMGALGVIKEDFKYKKISEETVMRLEHQTENELATRPSDESDLYQEDVQLIAKDGKLYYLPENNRIGNIEQ